MIELTSINAIQQAAQTVGPVPVITPVNVSITELPENLQQLLQQVQLKAVIDQQPNGSTVSVNTLQGELTLLLPALVGNDQRQLQQQLNTLFQAQRNLTLILQPGNPPTHAILLLPDQQGSANTIRLANTGHVSATGQPSVSLPVPERLQAGDQITAIILPPETGIPLLEEEPAQPTGTLAQTTPAPTVPGQIDIVQTANANQQLPSQSSPLTATAAPSTQSAAPLPTGLSYGQEISFTVQNVSDPRTASSVPPPSPQAIATTESAAPPVLPQPATLLQATVIGTTTNGQLVLQTDAARLYVRQSVELPTGSAVTLAVQQPKSTAPIVLQQQQQPTAFPVLPDIVTVLQQNNPQVAQNVLQNMIPNPAATMGAALMFFFSALRQGDVRSWLGANAVDTLERAGKLDLIHQMSAELRDSVTLETAPDQYTWRTYSLPLFVENAMHSVLLHVRDEQSHPTHKEQTGLHGQRFMLDVEMSRLGAVQIDGLSRPKKLDIVLRSEKPLPQELPNGLRDYYQSFLDSLGYAGSLGFQTGRQHWLSLKQPPKTTTMLS